MAVEVVQDDISTRQVVPITWDQEIVTGEIVQLHCVNPANGDKSQSGLTRNVGAGHVSYPEGYSGITEITVYDEQGNADFGAIEVGEGGEVSSPPVDPAYGVDEETGPVYPTHPIVLPPDSDLHPEHPIVLPEPPEEGAPVDPNYGIDEETGDVRPEHPIVLPPDSFPVRPVDPAYGIDEDEGVLRPSHPIVYPPDLGYNPPIGAQHPEPQA